MVLAFFKYSQTIDSDSSVIKLLFVTFMIAGNFILLNLFISVITEGLAFMRANPEEVKFDELLEEYLKVTTKFELTDIVFLKRL